MAFNSVVTLGRGGDAVVVQCGREGEQAAVLQLGNGNSARHNSFDLRW
jgi:hypothetical protein